jgi:hypothetical protein
VVPGSDTGREKVLLQSPLSPLSPLAESDSFQIFSFSSSLRKFILLRCYYLEKEIIILPALICLPISFRRTFRARSWVTILVTLRLGTGGVHES